MIKLKKFLSQKRMLLATNSKRIYTQNNLTKRISNSVLFFGITAISLYALSSNRNRKCEYDEEDEEHEDPEDVDLSPLVLLDDDSLIDENGAIRLEMLEKEKENGDLVDVREELNQQIQEEEEGEVQDEEEEEEDTLSEEEKEKAGEKKEKEKDLEALIRKVTPALSLTERLQMKEKMDKPIKMARDKFLARYERRISLSEKHKVPEKVEKKDLDERLKRIGVLDDELIEKREKNSKEMSQEKFGYGEASDREIDPFQYVRNYRRTAEGDSAGERENPPREWDEEERISGGPNNRNPFYGWKINDTDICRYALMKHNKGSIDAWHHYMTDRSKMLHPLLPDIVSLKDNKFTSKFGSSLSKLFDFTSLRNSFGIADLGSSIFVERLLAKTNVAMIEWEVVEHLKNCGAIDPSPLAIEEMRAVYPLDKYINQIYMPYGDPQGTKLLKMRDLRSFTPPQEKYRPLQIPISIVKEQDVNFYKELFLSVIDASLKNKGFIGTSGKKSLLMLPEFEKRSSSGLWPDSLVKYLYTLRTGFTASPLSTFYPLLTVPFKGSPSVSVEHKETQLDAPLYESETTNDQIHSSQPAPFSPPQRSLQQSLAQVSNERYSQVSSSFKKAFAGTTAVALAGVSVLVLRRPNHLHNVRQPTPKTLFRAFSTIKDFSPTPTSFTEILPKSELPSKFVSKAFGIKTKGYTDNLSVKLSSFSKNKMVFNWDLVQFNSDDVILLYDVPDVIAEQLVPSIANVNDGTFLITNMTINVDNSPWKLVGKALDLPELISQRKKYERQVNESVNTDFVECFDESETLCVLNDKDEKEAQSLFTHSYLGSSLRPVGSTEVRELLIFQKNPSSPVPTLQQLDEQIDQQWKDILKKDPSLEFDDFFISSLSGNKEALHAISKIIANEIAKVDDMQAVPSHEAVSSIYLSKIKWDLPVIENDMLNLMAEGKGEQIAELTDYRLNRNSGFPEGVADEKDFVGNAEMRRDISIDRMIESLNAKLESVPPEKRKAYLEQVQKRVNKFREEGPPDHLLRNSRRLPSDYFTDLPKYQSITHKYPLNKFPLEQDAQDQK